MASAATLLRAPPILAAEGPLETTTLRLGKAPGVCAAPQAIAEELLRAEGFTDIQYIEEPPGATELLAHGKIDFDTNYASNFVRAIDTGEPITLLAGVHVGCFELFANDSIRKSRISRERAWGYKRWDLTLKLCLHSWPPSRTRPYKGHPLGYRSVG